MNETAAGRTARHLAMCQELSDLGMQLARAAASQALRDADAQISVAPTATVPRRRRTPDPALLFVRLSRDIQHLIGLENRLAAGCTADAATRRLHADRSPAVHAPEPSSTALAPAAAPEPRLPDPRRAILRRAFDEITAGHPRRVALRRTLAVRIDLDLAADRECHKSAGVILAALAAEFGIDIVAARLSRKTCDDLVSNHRSLPARPGTGPGCTPPGCTPPGCTGPPRMVA